MDLQQHQRELGGVFHDYREGYKISLRDAAGEVLSAAQLSRFERGETDISTDVALKLMERLGMTTSEFINLQRRSAYALPMLLDIRAQTGDFERANAEIQRYRNAHADDANKYAQRFAELVFKCALADIDTPIQLSAADEQMLLRFVAYPDKWSTAELMALRVCVPYASREFRERCWQYFTSVQTTSYGSNRTGLLTIFLLTLAKFGEWDDFDARQPDLLHILVTPVLRDRVLQTPVSVLVRVIAEWRAAGSPAEYKPAEQFFHALSAIGAGKQVPYLRSWWHLAQYPAASHHHHLGDVQLPETDGDDNRAGQFGGPAMAALRRRRHLSIKDVSLYWSTSAQSRYETGTNQLSLGRLDLLKDFLLGGWADVVESNTAFTRIYDYLDQIDELYDYGQLTASRIKQLANEFAAGGGQIVPAVLQCQRSEIVATGYNYLQIPMAEDELSAIRSVLGQGYRWNTDLLFILQGSAYCLPPEQCYQLWRSLFGVDRGFKTDVVNCQYLHVFIAMRLAETHSVDAARRMAIELRQFLPTVRFATNTSSIVLLAALICDWTVKPTSAVVKRIDEYWVELNIIGFDWITDELKPIVDRILK